MARMNCLYKLVDDYKIVGGALLFLKDDILNVGRIFVNPEYFRKGYGIFMMQQIEAMFPQVKTFSLDTPIWNIRTNAFYQKLGYEEVRRDGDFVYYEKRRDTE
jgi:ribosomal protein S18 acetylase RimI-like enzyme